MKSINVETYNKRIRKEHNSLWFIQGSDWLRYEKKILMIGIKIGDQQENPTLLSPKRSALFLNFW